MRFLGANLPLRPSGAGLDAARVRGAGLPRIGEPKIRAARQEAARGLFPSGGRPLGAPNPVQKFTDTPPLRP